MEDNKILVSGVNVLLFENFVFFGNLSDFVEILSELRWVNVRMWEFIIGIKLIYKMFMFNLIICCVWGLCDVYLVWLY